MQYAEWNACVFVASNSGKTNLCSKIRATQGKGLMPDGTSRFTARGKVCSDTRTVQLLKRPPG